VVGSCELYLQAGCEALSPVTVKGIFSVVTLCSAEITGISEEPISSIFTTVGHAKQEASKWLSPSSCQFLNWFTLPPLGWRQYAPRNAGGFLPNYTALLVDSKGFL
jgi:hypothetical protein